MPFKRSKKAKAQFAPHGGDAPAPGELAALRVGNAPEVDVRIVSVTDDAAVIRIIGSRKLSPGPAVMDYTSLLGLCRAKGRVLPAEGDADHLLFEPEGEIERRQRRSYARVDTTQPVTLVLADGSAPAIGTYTVNISGSGVLLAGPGNLREGQEVELALKLDDDGEGPLVARGRVTRTTIEGYRGVRIEDISDHHRDRLVRFVFKRERAARQAESGR